MRVATSPVLRRILKVAAIGSVALLAVLVLGAIYAGAVVLSREPVRSVTSTVHPEIPRTACIECHAPIAEEWSASFHRRSLTGPYWHDVRTKGYLDIFNKVRKPCENCHAPANVLDLAAAADTGAGGVELGVECTPNLLREPSGVTPALRDDEPALGVDCTSCHVARAGILGSGRAPTPVHETLADARFQDPVQTATRLCSTCHRSVVDAWAESRYAASGTTCLDCHMPRVDAPSVAGGPSRARRSHRFVADKDDAMIRRAIDASLEITGDRQARVRIANVGVGHHLPSGGNALLVDVNVLDDAGALRQTSRELLYRAEGLLLDFWPFGTDTRLRPGERREILTSLPAGRGRVEVVLRYHDWMKVNREIATFTQAY